MYYYIVNPAAGDGRINKIQSKLQDSLRKNKIEGEFVKTTGKGDAARIIKIALRVGASTVVAVGGDSTVSEIINSLGEDPKSVLGIIPIGKTNILANSLGIVDWQQAIRVLAKRRVKTIDLGKVNNTFFITSLELGFEGDFTKDRSSVSLLRRFFLKKKIIEKIISFKPFDVKLGFDENFSVETKIFNFSVVNSRISKTKELFQNDGKLTAFLVPSQSRLTLVKNISKISQANYENLSFISKFRSKKITINTYDKPKNVYADSSLVGTTPVEVTVSSKKVKVIVSRNRGFK